MSAPAWLQRQVAELSASELRINADLPIVDVRSPSEFASGHIPGAINVPIFSDVERAELGTLYRHHPDEALGRGLAIATTKSLQLVDDVKNCAKQSDFVIHCWRGGMRSRGFAALCAEHQMRPRILQGGYRSFRSLVQAEFKKQRRLLVLSGCTGTGKTEFLHLLASAGEQTLDLEGLAVHKGSVFGGIEKTQQPTVEQFENQLFVELRLLDTERPVWIEDESRAIGKVFLPDTLWRQMSLSPAIVVELPIEQRIERLVTEYGQLPSDTLRDAVVLLRKRLGGLRLQETLEAIQCGELRSAVKHILHYYDRAYAKAFASRPGQQYATCQLQRVDANAMAQLRELGRGLQAKNS